MKKLAGRLPSELNVMLNKKLPCLVSSMDYNASMIDIGMKPVFSSNSVGSYMDDRDVVMPVVAIGHESRHYKLSKSPNMDVRVALSVVSGMYNPDYYICAWKELPCEIDAEFSGIMQAWDAISAICPDVVDCVMLDYVNWKTVETSYPIPAVDGGYAKKSQVISAFEEAYENSFVKSREAQGGFTKYEKDLVTNLLCEGGHFRPEMYYHFDKIIDHMPGPEKDRMMASLVLSVHPEIQDLFTCLKGVDLSVATVFGKPLPERSKDGPPDRELPDIPGPTGPVQPGFEKY